MSTGPCVFVVDDDGSVRDALQVLVQSAGLSFRGFASAEEFLEHYHPGQPGCLVTDVCLPGTDGLRLQQVLKERGIAIPIIVISGHGDIPMSVRMIREGALDFLEKPFRNHHMLQRVREALEEDARRRAEARAKAAVMERYRSLTPREREIAHLLMEGVPNKVIAAQLDLSTRTVEGHRATILRKMEVRSTATLTQHLMRLPEVAAADGDPLATA